MARRIDDDDDDGPRRGGRKRPAGMQLAQVLSIVGMVVWLGLFAAVAVGSVLFVVALRNAAPLQEAAVGATFSTAFIALYILARRVEKFTDTVRRVQS